MLIILMLVTVVSSSTVARVGPIRMSNKYGVDCKSPFRGLMDSVYNHVTPVVCSSVGKINPELWQSLRE
jgi:hypothetical protein